MSSLHTVLKAKGIQIFHHEDQLSLLCQGLRELADGNEGFQSSICDQVGSLSDQLHQLMASLVIAVPSSVPAPIPTIDSVPVPASPVATSIPAPVPHLF